jgi:hypothetical protein
MPALARHLRPEERRDLAAHHLARAARLWPPSIEERRAEALALLAEQHPTQFTTKHIICLARDGATAEERVAIATALLAGTGYRIINGSTP